MVLPLFFCPRLLSVICSALPFVIRNSSFVIDLGVPLAASGFGSGYPLLLAAYRQMFVLCLLAFPPASFLILNYYFIKRLVSAPIPHASRCSRPARTDKSRIVS